MKRNKSIIRLLLLGVAATGTVACTAGYEEINQDKSGASQEEMERDGYILSAALTGLQDYVIPVNVNTCQFTDCLLGGSFGGYMADSNDGFNGKNYATYNPEEHWIQVAFNDIIPEVFIRRTKVWNVTEDVVPRAVADVLRVLAISRVTDIYGPIPYSKIGEDGNLNAPYDSQEEVYKKMFEELDAAISTLTEHRMENFTPKADKVYNGNVEKWIKLANSIKLRLAMRVVNVDPVLAQAKATEAANHEVGTIVANEDNAYRELTTKNPFRVVMFEYNKGDSRVSADITSYMNGYKDPRREKYFVASTFEKPTVNGYLGLRSGIQIMSGDVVKNYANMNVEEASKLLWMNAAECAFLKAEGALRGWSMGTPAVSAASQAEGFYKMGIQLSFAQWGASGAEQYLSDATSQPEGYKDPAGIYSYNGVTSTITIKWDEGAAMEQKLERIITQKWIANFPLGIEAWSEFRRTGYPKLMPVVRNNSAGKVDAERMARRLPYPQDEYNENAANVSMAVSQYLKGPDTMGTDVWWAKK